jgi:hypothetical protein
MRLHPLSPWLVAACLTWVGCGGSPAPAGAGGEGGEGGAGEATGGSPGTGGKATGGTGGSKAPEPDAAAPTSPTPDAAPTPAPADASPDASPAASSGLVKIFDGTNFDNWVYNPNYWTLKEGAMVGKSTGGQSMAFTKKDYSNFRLIVWSRMVNGNDHLGICLWGGRPAMGSYGFNKCLLVIPPNAAIWDYLTNTDNPKPDYQKGMAEWHKTEILANRTTGRVLVAVNGKLLHDYMDPAAKLSKRQNGPIGMQIHKTGTESEYKDIEIEADPKDDKLITVP